MLNFSNAPPADPRGVALELMRTPPFKPMKAIVTSDDLVGCETHFYRGRTTPHDQIDCQPCIDGMPFRWHAWLSALLHGHRKHILYECTAQVAEKFVHYRNEHGTLRGCMFIAQRPSKQLNGRVSIEMQKANLDTINLPVAPDIRKCLSIIWNIALPELHIADRIKDTPRINHHANPEHQPGTAQGNGRLDLFPKPQNLHD